MTGVAATELESADGQSGDGSSVDSSGQGGVVLDDPLGDEDQADGADAKVEATESSGHGAKGETGQTGGEYGEDCSEQWGEPEPGVVGLVAWSGEVGVAVGADCHEGGVARDSWPVPVRTVRPMAAMPAPITNTPMMVHDGSRYSGIASITTMPTSTVVGLTKR